MTLTRPQLDALTDEFFTRFDWTATHSIKVRRFGQRLTITPRRATAFGCWTVGQIVGIDVNPTR